MGVVDLAKKGHVMAAGSAKKGFVHNVIGDVCTWASSDKKTQNRCKALTHLYDMGKSGVAAVGSCGTAVGAGAAEVGTAGAATPVAGPVGIMAAGSCVYNGASMGDSGYAMYKQLKTGDETQTFQDQGIEIGGAWIKKKAKQIYKAIKEAPPIPIENYQFMGP